MGESWRRAEGRQPPEGTLRGLTPLGPPRQSLRLDPLEADRDVNLFAYWAHHPVHAVLAAAQHRVGREAGALHPLGELRRTAPPQRQGYRLGDAVQGEVAGHVVAAFDRLDGSALEGEEGELLDVEEV